MDSFFFSLPKIVRTIDNIALIEVPATKYWQLTCEDDPTLLEERYLSTYLPHDLKTITA